VERDNIEILDKIDELQEHFYNYLFTKTVRDISLVVKLKEKDWDYIKRLEGQKSLIFGRRTFKIEEIYQVLVPFVKFIKGVREDVFPHFEIIVKTNTPRLSLSPQEKSIRNILVDNYERNIYTLGKIVLELYELVVVEDLKENKNSTPLCLIMVDIKDIEKDLSFIEDYQNK